MNAKFTWIGIVVGLLLLSVVTQLVGVFLAVNDPSFALEPEYEKKAANWDDHQRQLQENERLGWSVELTTATAETFGMVKVEATLLDSFARPIDGALVEVDAFHNARAADIFNARLVGSGKGRYAAELPLRRSGVWEFRFTAQRGEDLFTYTGRKSIMSSTHRKR